MFRELGRDGRLFTFQYVSINTATAHQREVLDLQTLHSNMFLLIRFWYTYLLPVVAHFTFQYVSINTILITGYLLCTITFTFQYVSINTSDQIRGIPSISIFTFQYVSINTGFGSLDEVFGYPFHSNMFLLIRA